MSLSDHGGLLSFSWPWGMTGHQNGKKQESLSHTIKESYLLKREQLPWASQWARNKPLLLCLVTEMWKLIIEGGIVMLQKLINLSDVYLSNTYIMTEWVLQWLITNCLCSLQQKEGCCLLWKLERVMSTLQDCFKNERAQHVSMSGTEQVLRVHGYYLNKYIKQMISSVQFSSQSCRTIYNPIDGSPQGIILSKTDGIFTNSL